MPKPNPKEYPPPLIIPPTSGTHKTTFIILHGRGSTAEIFATPLLAHIVSPPTDSPPEVQPQTFHSHFPDTKFIFPTASRRRAGAHNRSLIHQWFDMYPLDQYPPEYKEHVQLQGLRESAEYVHVLLEEAVAEVGAENVVLMGLSQGCAVGLVSLLLWKGVKLGGFVGMCGWLPLRKSMGDVLETVGEVGDADDVFEVEGDKEEKTKLEQVVDWLRAEIDFTTLDETMSAEMFASRETSIFLGHGTEDRKVPCELRMLAVEFLRNVDMEVTYQEYTELGHWYSGDMLRDIVVCLNGLKG